MSLICSAGFASDDDAQAAFLALCEQPGFLDAVCCPESFDYVRSRGVLYCCCEQCIELPLDDCTMFCDCDRCKDLELDYRHYSKVSCSKEFCWPISIHDCDNCNTLNGNNGEATNDDDYFSANPIWLTNSGDIEDLAAKIDYGFGNFRGGNPSYKKYRNQYWSRRPRLGVGPLYSLDRLEERYHYRPNELNGSNGEATNSDDVPKPTKAQRAAQSARDKARAKAGTKRKTQSTKQQSKRSNKSARTSGGMTYASGTPMVAVQPRAEEFKAIRGLKVKLDNVISPSTIIAANQVFYSFSVDRALFARTSLRPYFMLYDKWVNRGVTFEVIPAEPTNTAGLCQVVADPDAQDAPAIGTVLEDAYFSGHGKKSQEHSVFGAPFYINLPGSNRILFADTTRIGLPVSGTNSDVRMSSAGTITFAGSTGFTTTSSQLASIYAIVNFDFMSSAYTEDDGVLCCLKAGALSGSSIQPASTSVNCASLITAITSGSTAGSTASKIYVEGSYSQPFFDGTNFYLPRGFWAVKFFVGFGANPGTTTLNLNINGTPTYSSDWLLSVSSTNGNIPEYAGTPGSFASQVGSAQFNGNFRVVTPSAGKGAMLIAPVFTLTNSVAVSTFQVLVLRLPTVVGVSQIQQFPLGNSGSNIEVSSPITDQEVVCYKPKVHTSLTQSVIKADWEKYLEYKKQQEGPLHISVEEKCDSPIEAEVIENPMTKSVHMSSSAASALLSLVSRK